LDVGGVSLAAGGVVTPLGRRQLPDVADLVSGVVYSASARGDALPSRSGYTLRVEGAPDLDVAPFTVSANSPGEPADLRVLSEDGRRDDGRRGPVALAAGAPIELTWESEAGDDAIYVDVTLATGAVSARCLISDSGDTGRAVLPATVLGGLNAGDEGSLAVHRLHREPFHARGVDPGEVRFDFARVVPFVRR
jgi:hypothetical protein